MAEQITLLDVCKIPDVQIHSKTALFKYLVGRESSQMVKLRENIVRLSYTHKIIGVNGDEVGITSKRLPLKFKQSSIQNTKLPMSQPLRQDTGFISHRKFYVQPLPTVYKNQEEINQKQQHRREALNSISNIRVVAQSASKPMRVKNKVDNAIQFVGQQTAYRSTKSLRARSQSTARLSVYKKEWTGKKQLSKPRPVIQIRNRNIKSFSNLLSGIKKSRESDFNITSVVQEENCLFKRFQRLSEHQTRIVPTNDECFVRIQDN